jgi:acyl carrier protein
MNKVENIIISVLKDIGDEQNIKELENPSINTVLLGHALDSLGIVFLVAEIESAISAEFSVEILVADERAMSQKTSPFRSVNTLIKYVTILIDEKGLKD